MSWKNSGSRAWIFTGHWQGVGQAQVWPFSKSDADAYYDEGDITTHISNPVWRTDPTGPTDREEHDPCGYWLGEAPRYYTTLMYPLEVFDLISGHVEALDGIFKDVFHFQEFLEGLDGEEDFVSGVFRSLIITYSYTESLDGEPEFVSGEFKDIILEYTVPTESLEAEPDFASAKHWEIVQYQYWPTESLEATAIAFESGEFYV